MWTRDGVEISGENYSIALSKGNNSRVVYQESLYYSNLTIRGRLPGVYEYFVTNRATPTIQNQSYTIEGTFLISYHKATINFTLQVEVQ